MIDNPVPDHELASVDPGDAASSNAPESVDLGDYTFPKWALMALDPSGKRQLLVRKLVSGIESDAIVFRELEGERKLSVAKWNKEAYPAAKMARPAREVRFARMLASSAQAGRFARLLASQDLAGGYRESWWEHYNVGDMQNLSTSVFEEGKRPPLSLMFRCVAQCLEGIQCLCQLDLRHIDLHGGNVFFHFAEGALYPDAVIGDFGHSRFKGERPPKLTTSQLGMMRFKDKQAFLSPKLNSDETYGTEDWSWRLRWDLHSFQIKVPEVLLEKLSGKDAENHLLFAFFKRMGKLCEQDEKDRKLPEAERPPIQLGDLTLLIQDAWTLERLYADTAPDNRALGEVREKLLGVVRRWSSEPQMFGDEQEARDKFEKFIDAGMLKVVDLTDDKSIEVAAAQLAALKIKDSAFVSDQGDTSSSGTRDSTSPAPSSKTRESTPEGGSVQQGTEQDTEQESAGQQASSTQSHASTRWTPATRGLAEATAFASGDASALDALLAARDAAEEAQALIRNEHARRRRRERQRRGRLFRR